MPVLNINEDEKKLLLIALVHDRVRLMHDWAQISDDDGRIDPDGDRWVIDGVVDAITDLRRKIETAADITKAAWHNQYVCLHPVKAMEAAETAVKSGDLTREEAAAALGIDIDFAEADAQIASIRERLERIEPGTWTTLPEDAEDWMFDVTDPEDKIVIASADTQTDGTKVAFYSYDLTSAEKHKIKRELQEIGDAVEAAEPALNAIKVKIDFNLGGKTTTLEGYSEGMARLVRDMDLAQRSF